MDFRERFRSAGDDGVGEDFFSRRKIFSSENFLDDEKINSGISSGENFLADEISDQKKTKPRYSSRRWRVAGDQHRNILKLLEHGVGIRRIAQIVGVGVRTVQRRKAFLDELSDSQRGFHDLGAGQVKRCPVHGAVNVWPCVMCAAEESKKASTLDE